MRSPRSSARTPKARQNADASGSRPMRGARQRKAERFAPPLGAHAPQRFAIFRTGWGLRTKSVCASWHPLGGRDPKAERMEAPSGAGDLKSLGFWGPGVVGECERCWASRGIAELPRAAPHRSQRVCLRRHLHPEVRAEMGSTSPAPRLVLGRSGMRTVCLALLAVAYAPLTTLFPGHPSPENGDDCQSSK